jgi:hypothetical protein
MNVDLFKALLGEVQAVRREVAQVRRQNDRIIFKLDNLGVCGPCGAIAASCQGEDSDQNNDQDSQLALAARQRCARYNASRTLACQKKISKF